MKSFCILKIIIDEFGAEKLYIISLNNVNEIVVIISSGVDSGVMINDPHYLKKNIYFSK